MRTLLRAWIPLLAGLALLAWGTTLAVNFAAHTWFVRELGLRARLAAIGTQEALVARIETGELNRVSALLDVLAGGDERISAAALCSPSLGTLARTAALPAPYACEALRARFPPGTSRELEFSDGASAHVTVVPLVDEGEVLAVLVLVQDLGFLARREAAITRFTLAAFAVIALLAVLVTVAARRAWWGTWTDELRRFLSLARLGAPTPGPGPAQRAPFQPLLQDVQRLVDELATERATSVAPWSPQRLHHVLREGLNGDSVVLLANREPYSHERGPGDHVRVVRPASGLVTALEPVMQACSGTWVAHGSGSADAETVDRRDRVRVPPGVGSYALRRVWLSEEEQKGYYYGFANEGLWPLCHLAHTRPEFRAADWVHYERVNRRFADAVCEEARGPDPVILVQDYHFALAPRMIRERLPRATIITFWHIPWPNAERFGICPWQAELLNGLLGSSVVGFHTQRHCSNFLESVERVLEARLDRERQAVVQRGRDCLVRSYPISIEWPSRWADAAPTAAECRASVLAELGAGRDALLGVGVDRLDYTKGIEERLLAVERTLERFPHLRGRFVFAQLAAPSRTLIGAYRALDERVEATAARINARFATRSYRPIALLRAQHDPPTVFRFLRAADVCYVSSLHDGMNLVAKEFVAARDDERGVLVLSRFTGAARELTGALLVNPYDLEEASAALATALAMAPEQQRERMRAMRRLVSEFNVFRWAGRMLVDAARIRQQGRLSDRFTMGLRTVRGTGP